MSKDFFSQQQQIWADVAIEELVRCGVSYFCLAPGSRSTPLALAVARNSKAKTQVHFDERGLGFHAVGYAATKSSGVAVITTSGTAVANLLPAVIEASKRKVPLVIITADRPTELRQTGANQTISQPHIFGSYVRWEFDMCVADPNIELSFVMTTMDQAVFRTQGELPGPVHINWMFREPFASSFSKSQLNSSDRKIYTSWKKKNEPFTVYKKAPSIISSEVIDELSKKLNACKKGVIVCGKLPSKKAAQNIARLANKLGWPIFADITSGLRLGSNYPEVIHHFQHLLSDVAEPTDVVLQFGGRITAKAFYQWVDTCTLKDYIMVLNHPLRNDPLHNVSYRVQACPGQMAQKLAVKVQTRKSKTSLKRWVEANCLSEELIEEASQRDNKVSEASVARIVSRLIPKGHAFFLSSSLPIRMFDSFAAIDSQAVPIGANRGASGIDGIVASASGFSVGHSKRVTLLIGDLAFLYDMNSLALLADQKHPMTIVILNNDGGGIFEFLPVSQQKKYFEEYFAAPHGYHFEGAAEQFGIKYVRVECASDFRNVYRDSLRGKCSTIIEVVCDRKSNTRFREKLSKDIKRKLRIKKRG